jgi:hypothetical protein
MDFMTEVKTVTGIPAVSGSKEILQKFLFNLGECESLCTNSTSQANVFRSIIECGIREGWPLLTVETVTAHYSISLYLSPTPSKLDRQACQVACLLICVSGWQIFSRFTT